MKYIESKGLETCRMGFPILPRYLVEKKLQKHPLQSANFNGAVILLCLLGKSTWTSNTFNSLSNWCHNGHLKGYQMSKMRPEDLVVSLQYIFSWFSFVEQTGFTADKQAKGKHSTLGGTLERLKHLCKQTYMFKIPASHINLVAYLMFGKCVCFLSHLWSMHSGSPVASLLVHQRSLLDVMGCSWGRTNLLQLAGFF